MSTFSTFQHFDAAIRSFNGDAKDPSLRISSQDGLDCYYAPIDWKNPSARIMLLGITPGETQARNALATAQRELKAGATVEAALAQAKREGAFSGAMRPNLVDLLDRIELNKWLGVDTCARLFSDKAELLQSASVLPYPVYVSGKNYNGTPDPTRTPFLRALIEQHFIPFIEAAPGSVLVPLGPVPTNVLAWLVEQGKVDADRILAGLPHPSGANAERIAYFLGRKQRQHLSAKTNADKLDKSRELLLTKVAGMIDKRT